MTLCHVEKFHVKSLTFKQYWAESGMEFRLAGRIMYSALPASSFAVYVDFAKRRTVQCIGDNLCAEPLRKVYHESII